MLVFVLTHVDWKYELDVVQPFFAHTPDWQERRQPPKTTHWKLKS